MTRCCTCQAARLAVALQVTATLGDLEGRMTLTGTWRRTETALTRGGRRVWLAVLTLLSAIYGCGGGDSTAPPPGNVPPAITAQPDTTCAVGDTLFLQASAEDPDGDALYYSATIVVTMEELWHGYLPTGGINEETGRFWFRASHNDSPRRRVLFVVDDRRGGRDTTAFVVGVP